MISSVAQLPLMARCLDRLRRSPLLYRLAKGAFWNSVAVGLPRLVPLAGYMVVARKLGKTGFGELGMIQNTIGMLGTFAGFGFGITATASLARYRHADPGKAGRILVLTMISAALVSCGITVWLSLNATYVADKWLRASQLAVPLQTASALLVLYCINGVQMAAFAGLEAFKELAYLSALSSIFALVSVLGALWGVEGAIWSLVASATFNCIIAAILFRPLAAKMQIKLSWSGCWAERGTLFTSSIPATLSNVLYSPVFWICSTMLVAQAHGYKEMGEFNAANQWRSAALIFPAIIGQAVIPIVAQCCAAGQRREALALLWRLVKSLAVAGVPCTGILMLLSKPILSAYGPGFSKGWLTFCFLQGAVLLQILQSPLIKYLEADGKFWLNLGFNFGQGVAMVACTFAFIQRGAVGLAAAIFCSFVLHSVWLGLYALRLRAVHRSGAADF